MKQIGPAMVEKVSGGAKLRAGGQGQRKIKKI
jgi:hypothetical protein